MGQWNLEEALLHFYEEFDLEKPLEFDLEKPLNESSSPIHSTLFRSVGSRRGPTKFRKS